MLSSPRLTDDGRVAQLQARLAGLSVETPAAWGIMTCHQMLGHLTTAMERASGGEPLLRRPSGLRHRLGRYLVFHSGMPWPRNVATVPELDLRGLPVPPADLFGHDLAQLHTGFALFAAAPPEALAPEHPYFGPMQRDEWMIWAYRHADHHLRQFGR